MLERNLLAEKKGRMINTWPRASRGNAPKKTRRQPGLPEGAKGLAKVPPATSNTEPIPIKPQSNNAS